MQMRYRTGATTRRHASPAVDAKILIDGGAYARFGLVTDVLRRASCSRRRTTSRRYRFDSTRVFTNKPPCGPKRGHGSRAAALRVRGAARPARREARRSIRSSSAGATSWARTRRTVNGQRITSNGFLAVPRRGRARARLEGRGAASCRFGRGLGVAGSMYISGTNYPIYPNEMPQAGVQLKVDRSRPRHGLHRRQRHRPGLELGRRVHRRRGARHATLDDVRVVAADTDLTPGRPRRVLARASRSWSATRRSTRRASCARRSSAAVAERVGGRRASACA